ncbi:MAG: tyrosinase family protein [Thermoanaerobaculia bacterium]
MPLETDPTRRDFIRTSAVALGAAAFPLGAAAEPKTKWRRMSLTDPAAAPHIESYKKALRAMLALPPDDPRNWYRVTFIHTLDCPHGNWWFLPWHRGYIGWFERIVREVSGDPGFALPYWDWTQEPRIPAVMFDDVLTPANPAFIGPFPEFETKFRDILAKAAYWNQVKLPSGDLDPRSQYAQLLIRGLRFPEDLWFDIIDDPRGQFFFDRAHARRLTKEHPDLDPDTAEAVSRTTLLDSLSPRDFQAFGSTKALRHSYATGSGVLEGQPHNLVHNDIGSLGFMQDMMSPVDPIFFLHHSNIDRLWDVWTRKQLARGYPHLPAGADYDRWAKEPFVFFVDEKGDPVTQTSAKDYEEIGRFDYDYQPGSGEEVVPKMLEAAPAALVEGREHEVELTVTSVAASGGARGRVVIPRATGAALELDEPLRLFARITVAMDPLRHGSKLRVFVNGPAELGDAGPESPHHAATVAMFGRQMRESDMTFLVPLADAIPDETENALRSEGGALTIRVVPERKMMGRQHALMAAPPADAEIVEIVIEEH